MAGFMLQVFSEDQISKFSKPAAPYNFRFKATVDKQVDSGVGQQQMFDGSWMSMAISKD